MKSDLTIGRVAKLAGVNLQTVRFYERCGIVTPVSRRGSGYFHQGYRYYNNESVKRIKFIKNAQVLGFTLKEIAGLLRLQVSQIAHCGDIKKKAEAKIADVQMKIAGLKSMEKVLKDLVKSCRSQATTEHCPILKSLGIQKR